MVSNRRQSQVLFLEIKTRADNVQTCPIRIFSAVLAKSSDGHFKIESNSKKYCMHQKLPFRCTSVLIFHYEIHHTILQRKHLTFIKR